MNETPLTLAFKRHTPQPPTKFPPPLLSLTNKSGSLLQLLFLSDSSLVITLPFRAHLFSPTLLFPEVGGSGTQEGGGTGKGEGGLLTAIMASFVGTAANLHGVNN